MSILPISNVINVSITNTPQGLTERNVNSLALFTNETPNNLDDYRIYISAAQVAEDYGTNSVTAAMANAIFQQSPNIRSGNGRLVILPLLASVSATSGDWETANISANLASIIAVDDGDLRVTIDGTNVDLTALDFTNCDDLIDVAEILQKKLLNCIVSATATAITFTSKKVGTASTVVVAALPGGAGTNLAAAGLFNTAAGTATSGANSSGETIEDAITRTSGAVSYTPIITNLNLEDGAIEDIADFIQARDFIFLAHVCSSADIAGIGTTIKDAGQDKTRILLYTEGQADANLMKSSYAGRGFSVNFNGSFTSQTMNLKTLTGITPDLGINQTIYAAANTAGVDLYVSYDGVPSVYSTGGNDFFDNVYMDLALKFALETAGFNYLRQTNTKIPQTEPGMSGLKAAYANVCVRYIANGSIAPGEWNSSETFGDPQTFRNNIRNFGYYIYSLPIVQQDQAERELRKAPLVQIAIKRAGAIHTSDVIVIIND